ncbi:histidine phosphatase family protein [Amycolatopsis sp., V23-08]|uniref:phosphoglycerate mutase (2,3-diphosphoglycerate-dependent) n=1 Tax=Amycolatopsis heterodermiae TaxID=3110235 RepID=A0ABU5R1U0_9PSEU|nr:histidine phosphatase family protein [Amycolatopsis sp., V23-08]MEA5360167.1 histidine phosphatase family protein [Amycolatopsis sp., V23-08]
MKVDLEWVGLLRHGESTGNVAREAAETAGVEVIDLAERDADVPLTALGRDQAEAAGALFAGRPPDVVVTSTYRRSWDTARLAAPAGVAIVPDERLRDRELGVLDLLTTRGVRERFPEEARRKRRLGRFYYRLPGGESWADVVLRVRPLLAELSAERPGARILFCAHEMTVFALRYLLEGVPEPDLMRAAATTAVPNASLTTWERDGDGGFSMVRAQETA